MRNAPAQAKPDNLGNGSGRWAVRFGAERQPALAAFSQWAQRYLAASPKDREAMQAEGLQLSQQRRAAFLELISSNPREALAETVPLTVRQQLPALLREQLENRVSGKGNFEVLATVPRQNGPQDAPAIVRQAVIGADRYTAHVYGNRKNQRSSANLSLHGVALDGQLALSDSPLRVLEAGETPPPGLKASEPVCSVSGQRPTGPDMVVAASGDQVHWLCRGGHLEVLEERIRAAEAGNQVPTGSGTAPSRAYATTGNRTILVMLVDFADSPGGPVSLETARAKLADVTGFVRSNAFNQIEFTTKDVTPVLRMPRTGASYVSSDDPYSLLADARGAATAAGFDTSRYDFDVLAFANIGFGWGGLGYVGAKGSWVQGDLHGGVTAHELGHNFGNWHANAWLSETVIGPDGAHREYGNPFDVLGGAWNYPRNHYSANFKYLNGWIPDSQLHTVTASGVYRIFAHDQGGSLKPARRYAIRIPIGILVGDETVDYWIDFRPGYGHATANGAVLKWGNDSGTVFASRLLDTQPGTFGDMEDAPLAVGRTFQDPFRSLSITTVAKGSSAGDPYLDIQVNFTPVTLQQSLDLSPALWVTGGAAPWAGQVFSTHDSMDAAASGLIRDKQESYVQTTLTGPGTLSFWWKVSSEESYDFLSFLMDGQVMESISGELGWQQRIWSVPAGAHTVRWLYSKDAYAIGGSDRGWLDQVTFTVATPLTNDVPFTGLSGLTGSQRAFKITVPSGQPQLSVSISGGPGDCDLYLRQGGPAPLQEWDYRPYLGGSDETVVVSNPAPGDWHILLHGFTDYQNVQLRARYGVGLPVITAQPLDVVADRSALVQFTVQVSSPTPVSYQWRRNGIDLGDNASVQGATSPTLSILAATRAHAGAYSVRVANEHGQALSQPATLRIVVPVVMRPPVRLPDGTMRIQLADPDGIPFVDPSEAEYFLVLASSDLVDWVSLDRSTVSNGMLEVVDPLSAYLPHRFYKAVAR